MKELTMLFTPIKIGTMEVRNRIVMAPMATNLADPDGRPSDRQIAYYAARARGGAGIIEPGVVEIDPAGKGTAFSPAIWDDSLIPTWKKFADAIHAHGAKLVPQLHHAGRETMSALTGLTPVAPSPIPCPVCKEMPLELTLEEIEDLIEKFGEGARRAREAGCDGVELHGAHGYLIAQFMSPFSNRRQDEYGGSLNARLKFPIEVIKRVRRKVGRDFPVIFRIVGEEMVDGGYTIEQTKIICRILAEAGVDALHISRGGSYSAIRWICPPHGSPMGLNTTEAAAIKSVVDVPVIVVGRLNDPLARTHS
jgi:2,4-dienoyl-CoA reductase-like NADH-dependent reductase (Old Yellow Enzyme family)